MDMTTSNATGTDRELTEVAAHAMRRRFTAEYKQRILREAQACVRPGELGALLRREGLYSSIFSRWREAAVKGLRENKRGPKAVVRDARDKRIEELERETKRLRARAERAEGLVEAQKKFSELLGIQLPRPDEER